MKESKPWEYRGVVVLPADRNAYGFRWTARPGTGIRLKAQSKEGMRRLIRDQLGIK